MARYVQPSVVFIDEIDSLLTARSDSDSDSIRRLKTEFLIQFDGAATSSDDNITLIGATNLPQKLDEAALRRFPKRILVPLPDERDRLELIRFLMKKQKNSITDVELREISKRLENYSASDLTQLAKDAAMAPLRELSAEQVKKLVITDESSPDYA